MAKKRSGLGRGIGALIPQAPAGADRPVDVFFPSAGGTAAATADSVASQLQQSGEADEKTGVTGYLSNAKSQHAQAVSAAGRTIDDTAPEAKAQQSLKTVPGAQLTELALTDITPNRVNPRTEFDEEALKELAHSIKEFGVFQPVVVRAIEPQPPIGQPRYELIMGERRFRASGRAGLKTIPAIVRSTADEDMLRDALLENLHRADLNPLEEASAYQQLMSDFGITQEQLAAKIGRSRPQIANTLRLLRLPESIQVRVADGRHSAGHARAILSLRDTEAMEKFSDKIIAEDMNVRAAESYAAKLKAPGKAKVRTGGINNFGAASKQLQELYETAVEINMGAKNGRIVFKWETFADLQRLLKALGAD
ncbi:ParB/RepB/Spo0J family partition protein [Canibacter zhoujuaniae]|uniref:ParB/RepB/Spo0J family partition protein n=1 Tax=Canibacter zhoujuaniae TaxID=2708343 RepID=UPI0014222694|nr:ParB/RepB/Spo0J family partition protein [Canibacter zhoujuaniae]